MPVAPIITPTGRTRNYHYTGSYSGTSSFSIIPDPLYPADNIGVSASSQGSVTAGYDWQINFQSFSAPGVSVRGPYSDLNQSANGTASGGTYTRNDTGSCDITFTTEEWHVYTPTDPSSGAKASLLIEERYKRGSTINVSASCNGAGVSATHTVGANYGDGISIGWGFTNGCSVRAAGHTASNSASCSMSESSSGVPYSSSPAYSGSWSIYNPCAILGGVCNIVTGGGTGSGTSSSANVSISNPDDARLGDATAFGNGESAPLFRQRVKLELDAVQALYNGSVSMQVGSGPSTSDNTVPVTGGLGELGWQSCSPTTSSAGVVAHDTSAYGNAVIDNNGGSSTTSALSGPTGTGGADLYQLQLVNPVGNAANDIISVTLPWYGFSSKTLTLGKKAGLVLDGAPLAIYYNAVGTVTKTDTAGGLQIAATAGGNGVMTQFRGQGTYVTDGGFHTVLNVQTSFAGYRYLRLWLTCPSGQTQNVSMQLLMPDPAHPGSNYTKQWDFKVKDVATQPYIDIDLCFPSNMGVNSDYSQSGPRPDDTTTHWFEVPGFSSMTLLLAAAGQMTLKKVEQISLNPPVFSFFNDYWVFNVDGALQYVDVLSGIPPYYPQGTYLTEGLVVSQDISTNPYAGGAVLQHGAWFDDTGTLTSGTYLYDTTAYQRFFYLLGFPPDCGDIFAGAGYGGEFVLRSKATLRSQVWGLVFNQNGTPASGATVQISDASSSVVASATTDSKGFYTVTNLQSVAYLSSPALSAQCSGQQITNVERGRGWRSRAYFATATTAQNPSYDVSPWGRHARAFQTQGHLWMGMATQIRPNSAAWMDRDSGIVGDRPCLKWEPSRNARLWLVYQTAAAGIQAAWSASEGASWSMAVTISTDSTAKYPVQLWTKQGLQFVFWYVPTGSGQIKGKVLDTFGNTVIAEYVAISTLVDDGPFTMDDYPLGSGVWRIGLLYRSNGQLVYKSSVDGKNFS